MPRSKDWLNVGASGDWASPELDANNLPVENTSHPKLKLHGNDRPLGSIKGAQYTRLPGKYQFGESRSIWDEEDTVAAGQSFLGKAGRGLVSRGLSVVPKVGQNIGHIGGAISFGMDYIRDRESADPNVIWDNSLANTMSQLDKDLRESMPIYKSYIGRNGNVLQQMGDPGFWFDDMFDSLAFLASAYITGGATGRIASTTARALNLGKAMTQKVTQAGKVYGATILNSIGESGFEAKDFMDSERAKQAYSNYGMPYESLTEEQQSEINERIAPGASNVFRSNMGVLLIPNFVQSKFMFGSLNRTAKSIREGVRTGRLTSKDISVFKEAARKATTGVFTEGPWEEGMQHALQTYNARKGSYGNTLDDYTLGVANEWVDNLFTTEGQKNMILGSMIGGIFGGFGGAREAIAEGKMIQQEEQEFEMMKGLLNMHDKFYQEHITVPYKSFTKVVKEEDEDGNTIDREVDTYYNDKGELEIDQEKAQRMFMQSIWNKFLFDEAMVASIDANETHMDQIRQDAIGRLFYNYAMTPGMDSLQEAANLLMEKELAVPEELAEKGYQTSVTMKDLQPFIDAFEQADNELLDADDFSDSKPRKAFKNVLRKALYGEKVKRNAYERHLRNENLSQEQREQVQRLIDDSESLTKKMKNRATREKLYEDYLQEQQDISDHNSRVEQLQKEKPGSDELKKAEYDRKEFAYINGSTDPFSSAFFHQIDPDKLANEFGARYNYFYKLGQSYYRKAKLNEAIDSAKNRRPYTDEDGNTQTATVSDVVNRMIQDIQNGVEYTKEEVEKVGALIEDKERLRPRWMQEASRREKAIDDNVEYSQEELDMFGIEDTFDPVKLARDQAWMEKHNERITDLENARRQYDDTLVGMELPTDKKQMRDRKRAYRTFQRQFADQPVERAQDIIDKQKSNPDAYDNVEGVLSAISDLQELKHIYSLPGKKRMLQTREFKGLIESIDKVLVELQGIEDIVREKANNRSLMDLQSQRSYSAGLFRAIGIEPNLSDGTYMIVNAQLYNAIKDAVLDIDLILDQAAGYKFEGKDFSFDSIFFERIISIAKQNKQGKEKILAVLNELDEQYKNEFEQVYTKLGIDPVSLQIRLAEYKRNPMKSFSDLLSYAIARQDKPSERVTVIDKFLRNKDIYELVNAINDGAEIGYDINRDDLKSLLDAHQKVIGIESINDRLKSDITIAEIIAKERSEIGDKAPSNQQRIALREAIIQHNTPIENPKKKFAGWVYLKGLGGTGKTQLISTYLTRLLGIKQESVVAVSTHENALQVLKKSIPGIEKTMLHTDLNDDVFSNNGNEVVIIDEIARLDLETMEDLAEMVAKANSKRDKPLRVYVMGDPSQVISEGDQRAAINTNKVNVKELSPLTAVFRSGNTALLEAQNFFLDFPGKVQKFIGLASKRIGEASEGVHVSPVGEDLIRQLNVHKKANTRSRAIVVSNKALANRYKDQGIPVFMHFEVAGLEFDEVYIDVNPKDFTTNGQFNQAMYTALSRSMAYSFVRSYESADNWKYREGEIKQEDVSQRAQDVRDDYTNRLQMESSNLTEELKDVRLSEPQKLIPEENTVDDIAQPATDTDHVDEPLSDTNNPSDEGVWEEGETLRSTHHELEYPSYAPVKQVGEEKISRVRAGSPVKYIIVGDQIWVIAQELNIATGQPLAKNIWHKVGVMSENELTNTPFGKELMNRKAKAQASGQYQNRLSKGDVGTLAFETNHPSILAEGTVHRARPLAYYYNKEGKVVASGPGFLQKVIDKVQLIFGQDTHQLDMSIRIFSESEIQNNAEFANNTAGVPYLIVKRRVKKDGEVITEKGSQFVRLSGRMLYESDSFIAPLKEFYGLVSQINQIPGLRYGNALTNELIKRFARNWEVSGGKLLQVEKRIYDFDAFIKERNQRSFPLLSEQQFSELEAIANKIVPLFYKPGVGRVKVETKEQALEKIGDKAQSTTEYTYEWEKDTGHIKRVNAKNPEQYEYLEEEKPVAGKGPAQVALDMLAKANTKASFSIIKPVSEQRGKGVRTERIRTGKSLLVEDRDTNPNLVTEAVLAELFSFNNDGSHASIYLPLKMRGNDGVNKLGEDINANRSTLEEMLGTKLEDIQRTRIQVKIDENAQPAAQTPDVKKKSSQEQRRSRRKNRFMLKGQQLGEQITLAKARELFHQMIPDTIDNPGAIKFMDQLTMKELAGEDAYGLYRDEMVYAMTRDGKTFRNIIRHEAFHKIFNEYLTDKERDRVVAAFRKEFPRHANKGFVEIEEELARAFHEYQGKRLNIVSRTLKSFFNWLASRFGFINQNVKNLDRFFQTIESGYFTHQKNRGFGITRQMRDIKKKYGTPNGGMQGALRNFKQSLGIVQDEIYNMFTYGYGHEQNEDGSFTRGTPVTKDEAVREAYYSIQQLYQDTKTDLEADPTNAELALELGYYERAIINYGDLVKTIYENYDPKSFQQNEISLEDNEVELEELIEQYREDADRVNLKDHIIANDEVNHERKINRIVKDYLSDIEFEGAMMNWREAYIRSLNLLEGLQTWSDNFIGQLENKLKSIGNSPRDTAIVDTIKEIYQRSVDPLTDEGKPLADNMKFLNEDTFVISDQSIKDKYSINDVMQTEEGNFFTRHKGESTRSFLVRIAARTNTSVDELSGQFRNMQALTTLRGIINVFNNQKQKNVFFVDSKREYGIVSTQYVPGSYMGIHRSLSSTMNDRLRNKLNDKTALDTWMKTWFNPTKKAFGSDKHGFVKSFLSELGMGNLSKDVPNVGIAKVYKDIEGFFARAEEVIGKPTPVDPEEAAMALTDEDLKQVAMRPRTMDDIVDKERKMVNGLSRLVSMSSSYMRATNVRDVEGKRKYTWSPTSNAHEILFNIVQNTLYKTGNISLEAPKHLRKEFFSQFNIFLNGKSKVYDIVDHDGVRESFPDRKPRVTTQESESDQMYLVRTFVSGYLDRIKHSSKNQPTYFQWLYPNERKAALGAEVDVMNKHQITEAVKLMIRQVMAREDKPHLRDYNKNNLVNFRLLEKAKGKKKLTEKNVDTLAEDVVSLMMDEARALAQTIIDQQVPFDSKTFTIGNLYKITEGWGKLDLTKFKNSSFAKDDVTRNRVEGEYAWTAEDIFPMVASFFANDYVNSYFLNQLIIGDYAQFKTEEDVMRRHGLATAPGHKPIVNSKFGMKTKARFMFLSDPFVDEKGVKRMIEDLLLTQEEKNKFDTIYKGFEGNIDSADGQGFMTPERYEELKYAGFNSEFGVGHVLKPVIYSMDENGDSRGVKYSSIVLSDELVTEFPSLAILRANMRRNQIDEAVFGTGMKVGTPVLPDGFENHGKILSGKWTAEDQAVYEVPNDDYRIQLDPRAKIESSVRQPSQLVYLAGVLPHNLKKAGRIYSHLSNLVRLGRANYFERFTPGTENFRKNIVNSLRGRGSEREHEMLSSGLSIDFPVLSNKVMTTLASQLQDNIVDIRWPGSKLVLQSEYGTAKYNKERYTGEKLKYFRDGNNRLVAEVILPKGFLPKEYEAQIEVAIAGEKHADNHFALPDLLGYRIPSSDVHSAVAMKVVGFYDTPDTSVIIAPDLLVALHGSDFDVDSLFVIKRDRDFKGEYAGYSQKNGKLVYNEKQPDYALLRDLRAYHKNGVLENLLDIVSSPENIEHMLAPIPMNPIKKLKNKVVKIRGLSSEMDLSNFNDKIRSQNNIFGASRAVGAFGNAMKAISYMMHTGQDQTQPKLNIEDEDNPIRINGKVYNQLTQIDETGESLTVSMDGFINIAIDNIRELALHSLNINDNTIKGFIGLRALGVPLETTAMILIQPTILEYGRNRQAAVRNLEGRLSSGGETSIADVELTDGILKVGAKFGETLDHIDPSNEKAFLQQYAVLSLFKQAEAVGEDISQLSDLLKIARVTPISKPELNRQLDLGQKILGIVDADGNLGEGSFIFDIPNLFKKSPHLLEVYQTLINFSGLVETTLKKYHPMFERHVDEILNNLGSFNVPVEDAREQIREQLMQYLISNDVYSGKYKVDENAVHRYKVGNQTRELTGPKAINQQFIGKVKTLQQYLSMKKDGEGNPITNMFLEHLSTPFNTITRTFDLKFEGRSNMDPMDVLDVSAAFLELNQYEVEYDSKKGTYNVIEHAEPRPDNQYSNLQNEFVTYGIMNWGLGFGAANYSMFMPADLYTEVDQLFNRLMDRYIDEAKGPFEFDKIKYDFMLQFAVNQADLIKSFPFEQKPVAVSTIQRFGRKVNNYQGEEHGYKFDRKFQKQEGKSYPLIIKTGFREDNMIFLRLNSEQDESIYYARVDKPSKLNSYYTTDEALNSGYDLYEAFNTKDREGRPIRNIQVSDFKNKNIEYYGEDIQKGDIVSFTKYHDISRVNKQYGIVKKTGMVMVSKLKDGVLTLQEVPGFTIDPITETEARPHAEDTVDTFVKPNAEEMQYIRDYYSEARNLDELIELMLLGTPSKRVTMFLETFRERITSQGLKIKFGRLPGNMKASYLHDGSITVDITKFSHIKNLEQRVQDINRSIAHEMAHSITMIPMEESEDLRAQVYGLIGEYFNQEDNGKLTPKDDRVRKILEKHLTGKYGDHYGFSNEFEFIAELFSNQNFARAIDALSQPKEKSLLRKIIDAILNFLGIRKGGKDFNTISYQMTEMFKNSPHGGQWTIVREHERGYIMQDNNGHHHLVTDIGLEDTIEDTAVTKETEEDETVKATNVILDAIIADSERVTVDKDENGQELGTYSVDGLQKKINRISDSITGFMSHFSKFKIDPSISFGQHKADQRWGSRPHDHKLRTDEGNMENYDEYKDRMEKTNVLGAVKGSVIHLMLKRHFNRLYNLAMNDQQILGEIHDKVSLTEGEISLDNYEWVNDPQKLRKIFKMAELNYFYEADANVKDIRVLPEVSIWNEILGVGGTMDVLAAHADGTFGIRDWKTGLRFGETFTDQVMKYGEQDIFITDNQRDRAKLQVMLYAFLLKAKHPEMRFRDLMVVWIPNEYSLDIQDNEKYVEVASYLRMIENFLKDKNALEAAGIPTDAYEKLKKDSPNIFDPTEYTDKVTGSLLKELLTSEYRPEEAYRKRIEEMTLILGRIKSDTANTRKVRVDELDNRDRQKLSALWNDIQMMRADRSMQLDAFPGKDIGKLTEWLGNYSDINMAEFQTWKKIRDENWNQYTQQHEIERKHFESLVTPIYQDYMKGKFRIRVSGIDRIANVNYAELFGFAFKEEMRDGYSKERLITEKDEEWKQLTDAQQKMLTYLNGKIAQWFASDGYLNKKGGEINGRSLSWLEIHNLNKKEDQKMKYYEGWFPKVMKTFEEMNYEEGARILGRTVGQGDVAGANLLGRFSPEALKRKIMIRTTRYIEDTFEMENDLKMALPIKYLGNYKIDNGRNYSKNLVFMFDRFNKSMLHKQAMDGVYITGEALKQYLTMKKDGSGQPMFENTVNFLDKKLIGDIQNRAKRTKWSQTPIRYGWYYDNTQNKMVRGNVDLDKIIESMMNWTSATIMWLRPMQGGGNGLHAKMLTYRESFKGSIASSFLNIDGNAVDFTVKDNIFADRVYFTDFLKDSMFGQLHKNKLWLLAQKLNYIPDNYDYATNRRFLLSTRNQAISSSSMYLFHSKPEEYVSLTTMAAQLHHLKHPGNGKSLWENYEVEKDPETGVYDVVWKGGVRGYEREGKGQAGQLKPITDLTSHEIAKMKKVHERMQGGYRKEEAANLEIYVLGRAFIQFKKYLPRLIMNALGSKKEVVDLGYYKKVVENGMKDENGDPVNIYEWTARLNEGRWRTLINVMLGFMGVNREQYRWSALEAEQKQNVIDALLTFGILGLSWAAYIALFYDDDDDDTFKKWWRNYLVLNLSQQYNPVDLLHTLESATRPVALARMYKFTESFVAMTLATGNLMFKDGEEAFTQDGDLKGWNNFKRSIPYVASWEDFASKMRNSDNTEEWFTEKFENKWR